MPKKNQPNDKPKEKTIQGKPKGKSKENAQKKTSQRNPKENPKEKTNQVKNIKDKLHPLKNEMDALITKLSQLPEEQRIDLLNYLKRKIAEASPFSHHPVDVVQWIPSEKVVANDYNPNKVAPPEMRLLHLSIKEDGYTQPIVAYYDKELDQYVIVDGFHRNRVGKEYEDIRASVKNHLPIVVINKDIKARMASTIRHNRARGTHQIQSMSQVVAELKLKGWSDKKIAAQLGMDKDEVLKLKQFAGLGDLFKNREFSKAWV